MRPAVVLCSMALTLASVGSLRAQSDSVDVVFFYRPQGNPDIVYLPGEFNNWGNNVNGRISDPRFAMTRDPATGVWSKTVRLRVGGPNPLPVPGLSIPGAYQYKFNENGSAAGWLPDPLNPRQNPRDHNNSFLFIQDPTIHYLLPNSVSGLVTEAQPEITAYIFPGTNSSVDAGSLRLVVDNTEYRDLAQAYHPSTRRFAFVLPDRLGNGSHTLKLFARTVAGSTAADSTTFLLQAQGFLQLMTRSNDRHLRPTKTIIGEIEDPQVEVTLVQNQADTVRLNADQAGRFAYEATLVEGDNTFLAFAVDGQGSRHEAGPVIIRYVVDHSPRPVIVMDRTGSQGLRLTFEGNDPDGDALSATWRSDDLRNPAPLGLNSTAPEVEINLPQTPGEYFIDLAVRDPAGNEGRARSYFVLDADGTVRLPDIRRNPRWVQDAVVYEIFVPAFTSAGTLQAARERLAQVQAVGANVIWLMPIYENGETINELNAGYNITDFFQVHPQLGTLDDFRAFLAAAHERGMRVILDTTPNHVSAAHPWVKDVELFGDFSNFRPMLETRILGDDRGLGQFATRREDEYVVYVHYSNWSLANLDYTNLETRDFMLSMYKYWLGQVGIDGYRMDVYWGPQNRYGKETWWGPFRQEIMRVQPDVFILGETDGTGPGSENNYADFGGASDAAYDWNFFGQVKNTLRGGSVNDLDNRVRNFTPNLNYNHFTGPHSHYLRFLENHDETRIAQEFRSDLRPTRAAATLLFTAPGIPLIYAGQEIGETSRRGKINWTRSGAQSLFRFYQRLAAIRNAFETFRSAEIKRIASGLSRVYAFLRPYRDQNAFAVINFSAANATPRLSIAESDLRLSSDSLRTGVTYYLNDVLNDTVYAVTKTSIRQFRLGLGAWESAVLVLADSVLHLVTGVERPPIAGVLESFRLLPNYPNPFNPETTLEFDAPRRAAVRLVIYNLLGQRIRTIVDRVVPAGRHRVTWDGRDQVGRDAASGVYVARLNAPGTVASIKLLKLK